MTIDRDLIAMTEAEIDHQEEMMTDRDSTAMIEVEKDRQEETAETAIDHASTETQEVATDLDAMILANYHVEKTRWADRKFSVEAVKMLRKAVMKSASSQVGEKMI